MKKKDNCKTVAECIERNVGMSVYEFLHPKDHYEVYNLKKGFELLSAAIQNGQFIFIMSDYDVDGIASGCIFEFLFREIGYTNYNIRFPKRFSEGYGIRDSVVGEIPENALLITVDNGITAIEPIQKAKEKDITVMIVDHHQPKRDENGNSILPDAEVIIDPHATGNCDFHDYCGAGLAYKLCSMLVHPKSKSVYLMLCMATLATIADVMPLVEDNRKIVLQGLKLLCEPSVCTNGLLALLKSYDMDRYITSTDIGFYIAPAINAMSRMNDDGAKTAFEYLTYHGEYEIAERNAEIMKITNEKRRELVFKGEKMIEDIIQKEGLYKQIPLCIYCPDLHEGIIGIIAGNLATKYKRPAIVFTDSNGFYKGSGRSYGGVNLYELLNECKDLFFKWGGHAEAAGMSIPKEMFSQLQHSLSDAFQRLSFKIRDTDDTYDLEVLPHELPCMIKELDKYQPFGQGNPFLRLLIREFRLFYDNNAKGYTRLLGKHKTHIKFCGERYHAIGFDLGSKYQALGNPLELNLLCTVNKNHYTNPQTGTLILTDQLECLDIDAVDSKEKRTTAAIDLAKFAEQLYHKRKGAAL